jgi:hypothetical protein
MNHIENDIPDTVDQIQPDNHQSGQMAHDSKITTLFASLQPQDVEQFYQNYQLWNITARIQALQADIEQVQQEQAANARLLEQYQPSPIAQAVLAQLQAHDVGDLDLLDQMLEQGDDWLDHTMQLLEQCEQLDIIHGNYTEWCVHALEGAYDWIGSMHERDVADEPEEPAATAEVFDESTEQLLLQKLLSDEEEIVVPATSEEPAEVEPISKEVITPEDAPAAEPAAQEGTLQIADDDIATTEEPDAPAADTEVEEDATNSEISEAIEIPEREDILEDDAETIAEEASPATDSDSHATLETDIAPSIDTFDEVEASVVELESATADETVESNSGTEEAEILEASTVQAPIEDQDEVVELTEDEQADAEVFTASADEEAVAETLEQDITEASDEQELQVENLAEIAELTERANDSEEVPAEALGKASAEPTSQEIAPDADEEKSIISSIIPAAEEQLEDNVVTDDVEVEVAPEQAEAEYDAVTEVAPEQVEAEYDVVAEVISEQVTEEAPGDEETDDAESNATPNHEYAYTAEEDTIAIPKIFFPTSRVTPLKAVAEVETQAAMPVSIQETPAIVEANTLPGLPAITLSAEGNTATPSTRPLPDIYGETNKQPVIAPTPAPIWREQSDAHVSSLLPQVSSPLLPEPHQGFFRRLWLKFLAWLRGE